MSLPASLTINGQDEQPASAPLFVDCVSMAGDNSYPTGGMSGSGIQALLQAAAKDSRTIVAIVGGECGGYLVGWDAAASKLVVRQSAGSAAPAVQIANGTDLSGTTFQLIVFSK